MHLFNWIIKLNSAKIQSWCCGWISPPTNPLFWLHSSWFCFYLSWINQQHICTTRQFRHDWTLGVLSAFAVAPPVHSSHRVTGSGTSPGSSGTVCWPMSSGTDCGPHKVGSANMLRTRTACFLSSMTSCEKRCQSCCGHGMSPFHWHLPQTRGDKSQVALVFEGEVPTYQHRRMAEPPSGSVGHNHWSKSSH